MGIREILYKKEGSRPDADENLGKIIPEKR